MKKVWMILIFAVFLVSLVAACGAGIAYLKMDWFYQGDAVNGLRAMNFECADAGCQTLGEKVYDETTSGNSVSIPYPVPSPGYGYGSYIFALCYRPMEVDWNPNCPGFWEYNMDFLKYGDCNAVIEDVDVTSDIDLGDTAYVSTAIISAFEEEDRAPYDEPDDPLLVKNFFSAQTNVSLKVFKDFALVHEDSSERFILRDTGEGVDFSWVPNEVGVYLACIYTNVPDCKCTNSLELGWCEEIEVHGLPIGCFNDSDCGDPYEEWYCVIGSACHSFFTPICNNPGTPESVCGGVGGGSCVGCEFGCFNGDCLPGECEIDDDCGEESYSENYCDNSHVVRDRLIPRCDFNECWTQNLTELVEECEFGCYNANCIDEPPVCEIDDDCGEESYSELYCMQGNVVNDHLTPICDDGDCEMNNATEVVEYCFYGCYEGECLPPEIECSEDSDCGDDGFVGELFCVGKNATQDYIEFTCNNPGCEGAFCSSVLSPQLLEECDYMCLDGECIDEPQDCEIDSDCGNESYSELYCIQGNVVNDHLIPFCNNGTCELSNVTELVENCLYGCLNGQCLPEGDDDDDSGGGGSSNRGSTRPNPPVVNMNQSHQQPVINLQNNNPSEADDVSLNSKTPNNSDFWSPLAILLIVLIVIIIIVIVIIAVR